jgi:hypothetical protein
MLRISMITITPDDVFCDVTDHVMVTGFRDGDSYFIIQREDLEEANFYVELDDQSQGCYDGLDKIIIQDDKIVFQLNPLGQRVLKTSTIVISVNIREKTTYKKVVEELELINNRLTKL